MIASTVPPSMLTSAVTIFELSLAAAMIAGGGGSGWLVDSVGFGTTYLIASTGHLVVLAAVLRMRSGRGGGGPGGRPGSRCLNNIRSGLGHLRQDAAVRWIVILSWVSFSLGMSVMGCWWRPGVSDVLGADASAWGG